jgi:acyl-CoA dehydrogenase
LNSKSVDAASARREAIYPLRFSIESPTVGSDNYSREPAIRTLIAFFEQKGLTALKEEDRNEQWYDDWLEFQATHRHYALLLTPKAYSGLGSEFDLLRYSRFLEVFAYFSPAHGYSLQVTFLGLCSILMGVNESLKREAVTLLEAGGLLAFGISERGHGSDLLGNEFKIAERAPGCFVANGTKYYIGNANCASMISILARKEDERSAGRARRAPMVLFALRPQKSEGFRTARKIRTLGVRAAFVGEFELKDHEFPEADLVAEGREAWDAVFGTVALGKFFLGFGSIGICEHAFEEAAAHLSGRMLYGKPAIEMPHIRATMVQAYCRLTAMKLYAYRALDYAQACSATDRRFLLFAAVQKAKLSTEGVKVIALLSECIGAKGFESETYFEMALRDVQLIPGLEGSTHINLGMTTQFVAAYLENPDSDLKEPVSLAACERLAGENPYLMELRTGAINTISFDHFLRAYRSFMSVPNVRLFVKSAKAFQLFIRHHSSDQASGAVTSATLALGRCLATIAYGQLIAENAACLDVPILIVSAIFYSLVSDLNLAMLSLASECEGVEFRQIPIQRLIAVPRITEEERDFISRLMTGTSEHHGRPE